MSSKSLTCGIVLALIALHPGFAAGSDKKLEPFTYKENFESNELQAWASYPLWQDTAYDPNLRPFAIVPGSPNISLVQKVTPYSHVDNYAGAQKKFDAYLAPGSFISLKVYLKTHLQPEFFKIRLAAGAEGKADVTFLSPATNVWVELSASYEDFVRENPGAKGKLIKVNALAVLAKFPKADPALPIFLGLDDVVFQGWHEARFLFTEPKMFWLSEWKPGIPEKHFEKGDFLTVRGTYPFPTDRIDLEIGIFAGGEKPLVRSALQRKGGEWRLDRMPLPLSEGLYLARLISYEGQDVLSRTEFTISILPRNIGQKHPRLWFDDKKLAWIQSRLKEARFQKVLAEVEKSALESRDKYPVDKFVFDVDNFPDDEPLLGNVPRSIYPWYDRINPWRNCLHANAFAFALLNDREAATYAKALLLRLSRFPFFLHPWFEKRGQHIYYPVGELAMEMALGYDILYGLMNEKERLLVREALMRNIVTGCHRSYVEDNLVTSNTSNWVAHITGGSVMCQAAIFGDGPDVLQSEPYLTGVIMKLNELIQKSMGRDGGYGESLGYCNFTMSSLSKALPALENVFHVDLSANLRNSYQDIVWAGNIQAKSFFHFGDSFAGLMPLTNWAWYLEKNPDPLLGWLYHFLKQGETIMDVLYRTENIPQKPPFSENPVRVFRDIGTTVFKSGWGKEDFTFVMRTGAFYNHQHLDQGTFWLADRGETFIEERHGSTYYDDPIYQSHYTQPIAHSTILIDRNPQSQRVGDPLLFAEGFDDHAFISHFLDGEQAAFSSGDIGRLYWGKVTAIQRNVLYIKPRTLLMLDSIVPARANADVSLLYQTLSLADLHPDPKISTIAKNGAVLSIRHLAPEKMIVEAIETPHYINTLKSENPLIKEGMLSVSARAEETILVMANLLTTLPQNEVQANYQKNVDCGFGAIQGMEFAFSTNPGHVYSVKGLSTDALAVSWTNRTIFGALLTTLSKNGNLLVHSEAPITCEVRDRFFKCYLAKPSDVTISCAVRPREVRIGDKKTKNFDYDEKQRLLRLKIPDGESVIAVL
jgi:Heparinase II/III-like protein